MIHIFALVTRPHSRRRKDTGNLLFVLHHFHFTLKKTRRLFNSRTNYNVIKSWCFVYLNGRSFSVNEHKSLCAFNFGPTIISFFHLATVISSRFLQPACSARVGEIFELARAMLGLKEAPLDRCLVNTQKSLYHGFVHNSQLNCFAGCNCDGRNEIVEF